MIIISDCNKDIVIPAGLGDNPGVVYETTGVKSLNGETGDLKIKTVNGNDMLGEGNVTIDTGVETLNGQKGALTLKTVNGNDMLGEGNIEIQAGSDNVIVLDGLTQEERKAIHDKLDLTKPLVKSFMYEGKISVCAWDSGGGNVKFLTFGNRYDGIQVKRYNFAPDGWLGEDDRGHTYTNSVLFSLGTHVEESGYFDAGYIGNFIEYIVRPFTRPNAAFINLEKGIGDSTQPIYAPVSFSVPEDGKNIRIRFIANEKLYTFIIDAEQENRWHFESAKPIGGVQSSEVSNIKVLTQSEYDALTTKDENVLYCIKG